MKISIDKEKCIKCGLCANVCPDAFVLKEDFSEIIVKQEKVDEIQESGDETAKKKLVDELEMAEMGCAVQSIKIERDKKE